MSEVKMDYYYCPKCLHITTVPEYVPEMEYDVFAGGVKEKFNLRPGECIQCYLNLGEHNRYVHMGEGQITAEECLAFINDMARKSDPRFDPDAFYKRLNFNKTHSYTEDQNHSVTVECPYCHSKNTRKISGISKALNVALFGIFGNRSRQQWHCNNCNSDF